MSEHEINTITYGERIDTDVDTMLEGMMELFDDLCDLALSRVYNKTQGMAGGFDFNALSIECSKRALFLYLINCFGLVELNLLLCPEASIIK